MASEQQEQDRTEQATPYKLEEARKRGQVAKSIEVNAWLVLAACALVVFGLLESLIHGYLTASHYYLANAGDIALTPNTSVLLFKKVYSDLTSIFSPVIGIVVVAAALASFLQIGVIFSWHPLKPDFKRLNPAEGFKRIFNKKIIYELVKTSIKVVLVAALIWAAFVATIDQLLQLRGMAMNHQVREIASIAFIWVAIVMVGLGFIAIVDFAYVKWEYKDNMRMSRREIKEEVKRRDGDPQVKAKIKELQREAAKKGQSLVRIPDADVLITNPTHISVALQYDRERMSAPVVIAKGTGDLALQMRSKAFQAAVPIVENRSLARRLYKESALNESIPPEVFPDVAKILVEVARKKVVKS